MPKRLLTDTKLLSFGGDHFVAYPLIKAHVDKYGPIALQFDAHSDTWDSFARLIMARCSMRL